MDGWEGWVDDGWNLKTTSAGIRGGPHLLGRVLNRHSPGLRLPAAVPIDEASPSGVTGPDSRARTRQL